MIIRTIWAKIFKKVRFSCIRNSVIDKTSKVESGCNIVSMKMDRYSFCGYDCDIINAEIGSFCSIANNVVIGGAMHPIKWVSTSPVFYKGRDSVKKKFSEFKRVEDKKTIIGHDVWIGQGTYIKQGVSIGTGAVIGMGSIVTKDVLPYSIVAGNPAKLIRYRFSEEVVKGLLESEWWEFSDSKLSEMSKNIQNPEQFLKTLK